MRKKFFIYLIIPLFLLSCGESKESTNPSSNPSLNVKLKNGQIRARLSQQDLASTLSKDPYFIAYEKILSETKDDIASNKFNIRGLNKKKLASAAAPSKKGKEAFKDLTEAYRKAGIINPEEYLQKNIKLLYHFGKIGERYPELKEMSKIERKLLFGKISKQPQIDVKKIMQMKENR